MIRPPALIEGDQVYLLSTARKISADELKPAIELLKAWKLIPVIGETISANEFQFAGSDELRKLDFEKALFNPEIKMIWAARGGYGTVRIIDQIDFTAIKKNPKWICGFSDLTVLQQHMLKNFQLMSLHGTMPISLSKNTEASKVKLHDVLFGNELSYSLPHHPLNRTGTSNGILCGGNLSILVNLIGTASDIDTRGKILFIEDVDEHLYHFDRMMQQMKRIGKLSHLAGLIVGHLTDMKNLNPENPFGKTAEEIVADTVKEFSYPVCFGFPAGHEADNQPLIIGATINMQVKYDASLINFEL